jgi:hypothetical protein
MEAAEAAAAAKAPLGDVDDEALKGDIGDFEASEGFGASTGLDARGGLGAREGLNAVGE